MQSWGTFAGLSLLLAEAKARLDAWVNHEAVHLSEPSGWGIYSGGIHKGPFKAGRKLLSA